MRNRRGNENIHERSKREKSERKREAVRVESVRDARTATSTMNTSTKNTTRENTTMWRHARGNEDMEVLVTGTRDAVKQENTTISNEMKMEKDKESRSVSNVGVYGHEIQDEGKRQLYRAIGELMRLREKRKRAKIQYEYDTDDMNDGDGIIRSRQGMTTTTATSSSATAGPMTTMMMTSSTQRAPLHARRCTALVISTFRPLILATISRATSRRSISPMRRAELIVAGDAGVLTALDKWNPEKNGPFEKYVPSYVKNSIYTDLGASSSFSDAKIRTSEGELMNGALSIEELPGASVDDDQSGRIGAMRGDNEKDVQAFMDAMGEVMNPRQTAVVATLLGIGTNAKTAGTLDPLGSGPPTASKMAKEYGYTRSYISKVRDNRWIDLLNGRVLRCLFIAIFAPSFIPFLCA